MGAVIEVHHKTYARLGAERGHDLVSLCSRCHSRVHVLEKILRRTRPALTFAERLRRATLDVLTAGRLHAAGVA